MPRPAIDVLIRTLRDLEQSPDSSPHDPAMMKLRDEIARKIINFRLAKYAPESPETIPAPISDNSKAA